MGGEADSARDLTRRLEEALARHGVAGNVAVTFDMATLHGNGPTVSAELGSLVAEWGGLPEDARARRASDVARRLASERRAVSSLAPSPQQRFPDWLRPVTLAAGVLLAGLAAVRMYQLQAAQNAGAASVRKLDKGERDGDSKERAARAARVCEATRTRVMRGAAIGPSDAEGWLVELWALRSPQRPSVVDDPALADFVSKQTTALPGRIVWKGAPTLAALDGAETSVTVTEANVPGTGTPDYRGARLVFSGRFVPPYFDDAPRREYLRFARAMTDALDVDFAALYARCADSDAHHLGSWFRGPTPGGAVTSLLYFMGAFGEHPELRGSVLEPAGATARDLAYAFRNVSSSAGALKKARVMTMLGSEAGMIAGSDGHVSTIMYPFRDSNRASRSAHAIAHELDLDEVR